MRVDRLVVPSWIAAGVLWMLAIHAWRPATYPPQREREPAAITEDFAQLEGGEIVRAAEDVVRLNPFRLDRRPAPISFGAPPDLGQNVVPSAETNKPPLAVAGIIGGGPWAVIVEGLPGLDHGVLLHLGEEAHGLTVQGIRGDTVRITGYDTTWTLVPKRPWTSNH